MFFDLNYFQLINTRGLCKTVLLSKFFPKVFGRFQNPHVLYIRFGFEITQALTLTKIPGFAKPSTNNFLGIYHFYQSAFSTIISEYLNNLSYKNVI